VCSCKVPNTHAGRFDAKEENECDEIRNHEICTLSSFGRMGFAV
jgi:hypothetical protein